MNTRGAVSTAVLCVLSALLAAPAASSTTQSAEANLKTRIVSAVVYNGQAQVTRAGTVRLGEGPARIICDDLPVSFSHASLQVAARGTAVATILGTDVTVLKDHPSGSDL
ncbi:MAG: DUF4140 domain-containing protein, partial [Candidatus Krumholzibacteria bacterium]|nr:DUF4140 domain-containing protein [Candidatus Krumholzibacteria bacterium]